MSVVLFGRFMWWPPAALTRWWMPALFRGADENCNPSVGVIVPPFGAFIVFWKPGPLRSTPRWNCSQEA